MKKLPLDILNVIPSNPSGNEEVFNSGTTQSPKPIVKVHVSSGGGSVDGHNLQAVTGPEESGNLGGALDDNEGKTRASMGDAVEGRESPEREVLVNGVWEVPCYGVVGE